MVAVNVAAALVCSVAPAEAVVRLARTYPVFPCRRHFEEVTKNGRTTLLKPKSPLTAHGFQDATQDPEQIRAWWRRWPDALVGVPTGTQTGLLVVDFDSHKADAAAQDWIGEHTDWLLQTRSHTTLNGGRHYLYRLPPGAMYGSGVNLTLGGGVRVGIDLRCEGGYIIWWPIHGGVSTGEITALPAGLVDERRIEKRELPPLPAQSPIAWARDRQRLSDALAWLDPSSYETWSRAGMALHLHSGGSNDGFMLWHAWSAGEITGEVPSSYSGIEDCRYHWASYRQDKPRDKMVTVASLIQQAKGNGWAPPSARQELPPMPDDLPEIPPPEAYEEPRRTRQQPAPKKDAPKGRDVATVRLRSLSAVLGEEKEGRPWFFESILPAGAFLIVGRPKVGKSWLLFQLALAAADCGTFLNYAALDAFGVLYVAAEDDEVRIQSRFQKMGVQRIPANFQMILRDDLDTLSAEFSGQYRFAEWLDLYLAANPKLQVVILDTESTIRAVWDADRKLNEVSATRKDYTEVREFDHIAIRRQAFIGLVNHTGKRKGNTWVDIHELINRTNTAMAGASGSIVLADPQGQNPNDDSAKTRVLGIRGRDIKGEILLAVEQDERALFQNLGPYAEHQQTQAEDEVLQALEELCDGDTETWHTAADIAGFMGKRAGTVQRAISRMMKAGRKQWRHYRVETKKKAGARLIPISGARK